MTRHRVVIIGGGFGGLTAAKALRAAPVDVTLVDRTNHHLFQPLLYQVATGGLSPANIAVPIRRVLRHQKNVRVLMEEVRSIDAGARTVDLGSQRLSYASLIVAVGARHQYFGNDHWANDAPGLKTIEDATEIRRRILLAFEKAELESDADRVREWLTFVIIGAGPTGVELAGALGEISHQTLRADFRKIHPEAATIILVEIGNRVLGTYPPSLSAKAAQSLKALGVTLRLQSRVIHMDDSSVTLRAGEETTRISARTIIWAAGVQTAPLAAQLAATTGTSRDTAGRLRVQHDLSLAAHPEIFVIGDAALVTSPDGKPLPAVAPVAMQQGVYVGKVIRDRLANRESSPFRYKDRGNMATIGRAAAVADFGSWHLSGLPAWVAWLVIHLANLIEFDNRILVLVQWAWNYFTFGRAARLIVGRDPRQTLQGPY